MTKVIKKIWNTCTTILVILILLLAVALVGVRLFGLQVFTVLSGSMEPEYHTGALIYVKDVDPAELKEGDVITFMINEDTVGTHRIVGMVPSEEEPGLIRFRTKGDANDMEDGTLVHPKNILGTPVFSIPYLGYLADMIQNPPGTYIAISAGAIFLILIFLPDLLFEDDKKKKKGAEPKEEQPEAEQPKEELPEAEQPKEELPEHVDEP